MNFDTPSPSQETQPRQEKIKQLFAHCFEIQRFEDGDPIPVGGESVFSDETDIRIKADFEKFKDFFQETHAAAKKFESPKLQEWLAAQGIEIDAGLFAALYAFTKKFEKAYPENPDRSTTRAKLYAGKNRDLKLSDILEANGAECAEIAALAQGFLQHEGLGSSYFSGDALWDKEHEFSEQHSFIVIRHGAKTYIFDPTNPTETTGGTFPSIYAMDTDFDAEMAKGQKKFVTMTNILSKKQAYFGINNGTNVWPEKHIV
jgi:hypothetical protein